MKNRSDTNLIRHYCKLHQDQIFDVHDMMMQFRDIPPSNFRKYVSRLVEEHVLTPISKGVYIIAYTDSEVLINEAIHQYYITGDTRLAKDSLLFVCGIIKENPKVHTYYKVWDQGNKKIGDYQFLESKVYMNFFNRAKVTTLDLIALEKEIDEDDLGNYSKFLSTVLPGYKENQYCWEPDVDYPRWVYMRLANLLDSMHISNRVMEYYENKIKGTDRLE